MTRDHRDEPSAASGKDPVANDYRVDEIGFEEVDFGDFSQWLELELAQLVSDYRHFSTARSALARR